MITKDEYDAKIKNLMKKWKNKHKTQSKSDKFVFIDDGIIDSKKWFSNDPKFKCKKILFLLKEAYGGNKSWSLTKSLRNKDDDPIKERVWQRVVQWTYAIVNTDSQSICKFDLNDIDEHFYDYLDNIAIVNVKKSNGKPKSDMKEILAYSKNDTELLAEEIRLIEPDIIVCCYTFEALQNVFNLNSIENSCNYRDDDNWFYITNEISNKNQIILNFYHPSYYSVKDLLLYYSVAGIYQQALLSIEGK